MSALPEAPAWFAPTAAELAIDRAESTHSPTEFVRLWRGFMTARVTLGLVLLLLQATLWALGQLPSPLLLFICGGYLAVTIAHRFYAEPRQLGRNFDPQWVFAIGIDLAVFSALQFLQGASINYVPLLALPVLLASVLGSLFLAMGTAASASLLLLAHSSWLALYGPSDATAYFVQSALMGAGFFVIAMLSNQLSTGLAQEEQRSRVNQMAVQIQRQVNTLVIETLTDGILVVDATGKVRAANPAARQLLGSEQSQRSASFNLNDESAWSGMADLARMSFVRTELRRSDVTVHHAGQGLRRLRVRTRQTGKDTPDGESLCVMFLQDQREIEARVRTDKLASMGRMSAAVAHEIRNPLAAIAQANALLDEDITDPRHKQLTQMVAQNASRLGKIVDEVLNISRVQTRDAVAAIQSLALVESVDRISHDWAVQTQSTDMLKVVVDLNAAATQVAFEPEHLRRVLINLLDNARRYASGTPGSIQVGADLGQGGQGEMFVWSDGQPLEQSVERHLFEPFFSSESRSSGLGLYICRELCDGHGATILYRRNQQKMQEDTVDGNEFLISFRTARSGDRVTAATGSTF